MAKCLVSGGAGSIGSHVCERLLQNGHQVRVLDDFSAGKREHTASMQADLEVFEGDVRNANLLAQTTKKMDVVFHHAAITSVVRSVANPTLEQEVNLDGTLRLLHAARKNSVRQFVFASTAASYGDDPTPAKKESLTP